jgi:chemotaxis protein methyltransferase CheR
MLMSEPMVREISEREFARFQRLIADASGISLTDGKRQLLVGRVGRVMREHRLESYAAYLDMIEADRTGAELVRLLDLITTNETRFFRERGHFEFLTTSCYPAWKEAAIAGKRSRSIRVWSAACSTGQEPYSIAMTLLEHFPASEGWSIEILASDLSTRALAVAAEGAYELAKSVEIPSRYLLRFMMRGVGSRAGTMRASPALRSAVRFRRINLNEAFDDAPGQFDLVFCCNALIYFSRDGRADVVRRLTGKLAPGGHLFVGHAESLHEHRALVRSVAPTVYAHNTHSNS